MTPASGGIVIPRSGYYRVQGQVTWMLTGNDADIHIIALLLNGVRIQHVPYPGISNERFNTYTHFSNYLQAGDILALQVLTKDPSGNDHFSADLTAEWLHH